MAMEKKKPFVLKQPPMSNVIFALVPLEIFSVYLFGWRSLAVLLVVNVFGFFSEFIFARIYKKQVTAAVFVTNFLFALSMPPTIPFWIAAVGIIFGVVFGKMVFGGFGRNVFNPALTGRAFIYVSFGYSMTSGFIEPASGFPAGFALWKPAVDTLTKATPLVKLGEGMKIPLTDLLFGFSSGSLGETCAFLIIIGGIFLTVKKTASFRIILGAAAAFALMQTVGFFMDSGSFRDPLSALLSGSLLFGIIFMATDPVSSSQTTNPGRWIYGALIGILIFLIRSFSIWPEAVTFAILTANMFAPLLDYLIKTYSGKKKAAAA